MFPPYLTFVLIGFVVATLGAMRAGEKAGIDRARVMDLALLMLALGVLGARLLAVLTDGKLDDFVHLCTDPAKVRPDAERDCLAALKFWQGGLTFYGGLLLAVPGAVWYCRRRRIDFLRMADVLAPFLLLGQGIGRIGCYLEGCCYGATTTGLFAPRHPTQLYEMVIDLALAALLWFVLRPRARGTGALFGWALALYGVARALLELWRADARGGIGPLSTSQLIAIPAVASGIWLIARARRTIGT